MDLEAFIRAVPDFPQPGILFRDITPLLAQPEALDEVTRRLARRFNGRGIDAVVGIESRGFLFGAPLALRMGAGFVPVRKPGKLPGPTHAASYDLEYGTNELHVHRDALRPGQRVLIVDDLLATGGTLGAALSLVETLGARVEAAAVVIELCALAGRERLGTLPVESLVRFE